MAILLSQGTSVWGQARPDAPATNAPVDRLMPLDVTVNGEKVGTWPFVERQGVLHASAEALEEWRLRVPAGAESITVRSVRYWPLTRVPGFAVKPNYANQSIELEFAPEAFTSTRVNVTQNERPPLTPVLPSAFANYELNLSASKPRGSAATWDLGALVETGASNQWGLLTTSLLGRSLAGTASNPTWTRLETTFTHDFPEKNRTLRLGDTGTRTGLWGRTVYYGGVQFGTNYSLTPGFLTQPVPIVRGVSAAPSTVELYVNGTLRQVSEVPAGPFAINNAAALTGGGEARLVVKDILGREVVITQPFFTSSSLLAAGLADWGVDAGALRLNLGEDSFSYGERFVAGTWRYGITDQLTAEARGEASKIMRVAGLGATVALPANILGRGALALSSSRESGTGHHWVLGAEKHWLKTSAYIQAEGSTRSFRSLGYGDSFLPSRSQWFATLQHTTDDWGSLSFALASVQSWTTAASRTASASYTVRVPGDITLNFNLSKALGVANGTSVGVVATMPLEQNRTASVTASRNGAGSDLYASAFQSAGLDTPLGWRVLGGLLNSDPHAEGGLYYQGRYGNLNGDLSVSRDSTAFRGGASGGVVYAAGQLFATRRMDQAYGVVEIKDFEGIGVGLGSTMVTSTNSRGFALIPNLGAYVPNQIRLDAQDLPISAEVESIEQIVVPPLRSAVKIEFPVRSGRAALLKINFDDGEPAPPGAVVRVTGDKAEFWVARRGEAYVTGLQNDNQLVLTWNDQSCRLNVRLPTFDRDNIARVGPIACQGVKR
jgi:outer membrane usher protein